MRKFAFLMFALTSISIACAQIPGAISYQGIIIDPSTHETVADGPHKVRFRLYDAAVNGNFKWESAELTVTTFRGLFTTIIPIPDNISWDIPLFIEPTLDGIEIGRIQLTTVPYAFKARTAEVALSMNASGLTGIIPDDRLSIHLQDLADGELSGSKIGPGIKAGNITDPSAGPIPNEVLDEDLQDLADGSLTGSKVGTGINADNITSGTLNGALVGPGIKASHITDASDGPIPNEVLDEDLQDLADGSLTGSKVGPGINADNVTIGTLNGALVGPGIKAANITDASAGPIPNSVLDEDLQDLADDGIISGTRVGPGIIAANITDASQGLIPNEVLDLDLQDLADGSLSGAKVGSGIDASNITTGTLDNLRLDDDLQDLADGTLSGSKIGTGINAGNITVGTLPNTVLDDDLRDLADDGILSASRIGTGISASNITTGTLPDNVLSTHLQDLADGSLTGSKVGTGISATNVTTGTLPVGVLSNAFTGAGTAGQIPVFTAARQLSNSSLYYQSAENELGINVANPQASIDVLHDNSHTNGTAISVTNSYNLATKQGVNISMTNNGPDSVKAVSIKIDGSGGGQKFGIWSDVNSGSTSGQGVGLWGRSSGSGAGDHYGVMGIAEGTGSGDQRGVYGQAILTSNNTHYGVYGEASGSTVANYAIYSNGNLHVAGNISYTGTVNYTSDEKLKKNILPMRSVLTDVMKLRPSTYFFRNREFSFLKFPNQRQFGLIAQQVEKIFPELVSEQVVAAENDVASNLVHDAVTYKSLDYTSLIPIIIKAVQEQQALIDNLKQEIDQMKTPLQEPKMSPVMRTSIKK